MIPNDLKAWLFTEVGNTAPPLSHYESKSCINRHSLTCKLRLGEGCFRGINLAKAALFQTPYSDIFTSSGSESVVSRAISLVRPWGGVVESGAYALSARELAVATAITVGASVVLNDLANVLCGEPPAIYNKVMSLIGPLRVSNNTVLAHHIPGLAGKEKTC